MADLPIPRDDIQTNIAPGVAFQFDPDSLHKLSAMLTSSMYSNKEVAVLSELGANAMDAHISAGVTVPFVVNLPTVLDHTLVIRDFGLGLSYADIVKFLTQYGKSSKESDNNQIGFYGIGSKSPAAVTNNWGVTSYHNGTEIHCEVVVDGGLPSLTKVYERPTTETGLKVTIPTKVRARLVWSEAAASAFSGYNVPPRLNVEWAAEKINGVKDAPRFGKPEEGWYFIHNKYSVNPTRIRLNQRFYTFEDAPASLDRYHYNFQNLVLDFGPGELRPTPNRESIQFDATAIRKINERIAAALEYYHNEVRRILDAAETTTAPVVSFMLELSKWREENGGRLLDGMLNSALAKLNFPHGVKSINMLDSIEIVETEDRCPKVVAALDGVVYRGHYHNPRNLSRVGIDPNLYAIRAMSPLDPARFIFYHTNGKPLQTNKLEYFSSQNPGRTVVVIFKGMALCNLQGFGSNINQDDVVVPKIPKVASLAPKPRTAPNRSGFYKLENNRWVTCPAPDKPEDYYYVEIENARSRVRPGGIFNVCGVESVIGDKKTVLGLKSGADPKGVISEAEMIEEIKKKLRDMLDLQAFVYYKCGWCETMRSFPNIAKKIFADDADLKLVLGTSNVSRARIQAAVTMYSYLLPDELQAFQQRTNKIENQYDSHPLRMVMNNNVLRYLNQQFA